jgi:hypothetical protein
MRFSKDIYFLLYLFPANSLTLTSELINFERTASANENIPFADGCVLLSRTKGTPRLTDGITIRSSKGIIAEI